MGRPELVNYAIQFYCPLPAGPEVKRSNRQTRFAGAAPRPKARISGVSANVRPHVGSLLTM